MDKLYELRVATVFSGGFAGPEWALKYAKIPHKIIFSCEIDKYARELYKTNHKADEFYKDVKEIDGTKYQDIDLFIGGFPCQAFSIAGHRKGFEDTRGTLFFEFARLIKEIKPRYFIGENVKGLLSHDKGKTFEIICATLREIGYHITYKVLNAKHYGTPQNRERIFIVGFKYAEDYHKFDFQEPKELKIKLLDLLDREVDEKYFMSERGLKGIKNSKFVTNKNSIQTKDTVRCLTQRDYKGPPCIDVRRLGHVGISSKQGTRVYDPKGLSVTLNGEGGGWGAKTGLYKIEGKERVRKLTPRECFRCMGDFEDRVDFGNLSDTQLYRNAGNGIEINTFKSILESLFKTEKKETLF